LPLARAVLGRHAGDLVDVASPRRTAVAVAGSMVVVVGLALLVLPGPGLVLLTAGLALLASEFAWAPSAG
jgi:Putative transmembrane protein (PGPGW)